MNATSFLLLLVFVAAGYVLQPMLMMVEGDKVPKSKETKQVNDQQSSTAEGKSSEVDLSLVTSGDFPEKVTLMESVEVLGSGNSQPVRIAAGTDVEPLALEGEELTFQAPNMVAQGKVHVDKTNFRLRVKPILEAKQHGGQPTDMETTDTPVEPESIEPSEPAEEPKETIVDEPSDVVPPVTPEIEEPVEERIVLDEAQMVEAMKRSVRAGKVTEIKEEGLKEWTKGEDEEIDGTRYQVGIVQYEAETIFGSKKQEVKALFSQGVLVKWIWSGTGMQVQ